MCTASDDLEVDIDASSNFAMLTGKLKGVSMTASRLIYNDFAVSGGAAVYTDEIILESSSVSSFPNPPRLAKPFSISVQANLLEGDLNRIGPVRTGLEQLLREIISTGLSGAIGRALPADIGGVTCTLDRVQLTDKGSTEEPSFFNWRPKPQDTDGKLVFRAHTTLPSGRVIHFAVRTGLCTMDDGQIIKLRDPEFIWRNVTVPMITIDTIGVQLDPTSKLTRVDIDKGTISTDGILVISPYPDLTVQTLRSTAAATEGRRQAHRSRESTRRELPRNKN